MTEDEIDQKLNVANTMLRIYCGRASNSVVNSCHAVRLVVSCRDEATGVVAVWKPDLLQPIRLQRVEVETIADLFARSVAAAAYWGTP